MASLLITNARLVTLDAENRCLENGKLFIEDQLIIDAGHFPDDQYSPDRTLDAGGRVVMPGLINAHHHLYSTFARGFTPPGEPARNFEQILSRLWWKLDRALEPEDVYQSSLLVLMEAARAGCTTVIDHHASPSCVDGSLDEVERAFRDVGLSGCLCYEVSDRNVQGEGIEENERYIRKCRDAGGGQMAALFGLHALMTLGDHTLERCADIAHSLDAGFHVHAAEDAADPRIVRERHGQGIMERFLAYGIPGPETIFVHGVHLAADELDVLRETDSFVAVNPESNMNNAVGSPPVLEMLARGVNLALGTDGMSSRMVSQARALFLSARAEHGDPTVAFAEACQALLEGNRILCNRLFPEPRGMLAPGQLADIVIPDYRPFTPLDEDTFYGHLLFGIVDAPVHTVIARGRIVVEEGSLPHLDENAIRARGIERARNLWARIE
ncbi:MAG: putative aminohydrolase SsnA [Xanthomonadales bacterium]|nr:putative aminohydrolase SsnA [Xanthomonadales bacterium]